MSPPLYGEQMGSPFPGPTPPYTNPPIQPQDYQPRRFVISAIALGATTTITATTDMDYVVGQLVRLLIPPSYGSIQLSNQQGVVVSLPASNQIEISINSSIGVNSFISSPYTATITGATQADPCVLTCASSFRAGQYVTISDVEGMTELNGQIASIIACNLTTVTIDVDADEYSAYTDGGTATLLNHDTTQPQVIAVGEYNSGIISSTGRNIPSTNIPGAFINIS